MPQLNLAAIPLGLSLFLGVALSAEDWYQCPEQDTFWDVGTDRCESCSGYCFDAEQRGMTKECQRLCPEYIASQQKADLTVNENSAGKSADGSTSLTTVVVVVAVIAGVLIVVVGAVLVVVYRKRTAPTGDLDLESSRTPSNAGNGGESETGASLLHLPHQETVEGQHGSQRLLPGYLCHSVPVNVGTDPADDRLRFRSDEKYT
ncbi:hypothetical protein BaRGS_00007238 [Batillaria attramentaria]|uniref:Uncharacterized protein n=1 Tax=Batillaria attramentaria TaxID=370345 RepID=A0ABD0LPL2_9CAEN